MHVVFQLCTTGERAQAYFVFGSQKFLVFVAANSASFERQKEKQ